ncbi:hypothetical protein LUZ60_006115 [Juncus effusus]|nr:hypothetical protein LUZ60_006115 [Juncus effusus]
MKTMHPAAVAPAITKPRSALPRRRRRSDLAGDAVGMADDVAPAVSTSSCLQSEISTESAVAFTGKRAVERPEVKADAKRSKKEQQEAVSYDSTSVMESSCVESASVCKIVRSSSPDLVCSEQISSADSDSDSDESVCMESDLVLLSSDECEFSSSDDTISSSQYSLSSLIGSSCYASSSSGSEFTDGCRGRSEQPSLAFAQFLQLTRQFTGGSIAMRSNLIAGDGLIGECELEFEGRKLIEEEDEESYMRFRGRERKEIPPHNYLSSYTTPHGNLILTQRRTMIAWIIQRCQEMELQLETLFLAVSLLDRFLSRGYFKSGRNLQLLGIACITLATRIEENQIDNSVRQRVFRVENNSFSRSEVVAMEWLVQEILDFKCFLPTTLQFLWFYLKAATVGQEVEERSRFLAVLALIDHKRLSFWPSTLAAGIVILACLSTGHDHLTHLVMETHMRTRDDDLPECIKSLEWLIQYSRD